MRREPNKQHPGHAPFWAGLIDRQAPGEWRHKYSTTQALHVLGISKPDTRKGVLRFQDYRVSE